MIDDTLSQNLILEEFKILRGEIELRGSAHRTIERSVILADAAIYGALLFREKTPSVSIMEIMWFLPPLIGLLALIRWWESVMIIQLLARYLRHIEQGQLGRTDVGWESYLDRVRVGKKIGAFWYVYILFWWCLIGLPLFVAIQQVGGLNGWNLDEAHLIAWPLIALVVIAASFIYLRFVPILDPGDA